MTNQYSNNSSESPKFFIRSILLSETLEIPITEKEFEDLKEAAQKLVAGFELEELYDLIINNYRELEKEVISLAVDDMVLAKDESDDLFEIRFALNRRVVNLLTTAKMYLDQYIQRLNKFDCDISTVKSVCSNIYDNFFEYRFMEALRNHAQHGGMTVHCVTLLHSPWDIQSGKKQKRAFSIAIYVRKLELEKNGHFKKRILSECPEKVNIISAARIYVSGIASLHKHVRELIERPLKDARSVFENAVARYEERRPGQRIGLQAACKKRGEIIDKVNIVFEADDTRKFLLKRNKTVENLSKYFVTSVSLDDDKP